MFGCATCKGPVQGNTTSSAPTAILDKSSELLFSGNYQLVTYTGGGYPHPVGSPTGVIVADGLSVYGISQKGKYLLVHINDIAARPDLFTVIDVTDSIYVDAAKALNVDLDYQPIVPVAQIIPTFTHVDDGSLIILEPEDETEEFIHTDKVEVNGIVGDIIKKEDAMLLTDFRDKFGYTHHLQVMAEIKSGQLKSEKRNKKLYVWHN